MKNELKSIKVFKVIIVKNSVLLILLILIIINHNTLILLYTLTNNLQVCQKQSNKILWYLDILKISQKHLSTW